VVMTIWLSCFKQSQANDGQRDELKRMHWRDLRDKYDEVYCEPGSAAKDSTDGLVFR